MDHLLQDLRYGLRLLAKKPAFTVVAILTLALGIGANSSIFSVVYGVLLRPLPYPSPHQLFAVEWGQDTRVVHTSLTGPEIKFLKEQLSQQTASAIESFAVSADSTRVSLMVGDTAQSIRSLKVSPQYFRLLGVSLQGGAGFSTEGDQGVPATVVLSHSLWVNMFGANPGVLQGSINLGGRKYTVSGILPADFESYPPAAVYLPFRLDEHDPNYVGSNYTAIVRVNDGFTSKQARSQLAALSAEFRRVHPQADPRGRFGFTLTGYRESLRSEAISRDLMVLQIAVGLVLLIACTNLASLLFARGSGRRHEIAIRIALGATRARVTRLLLIEDLLLAVGGGLVALFLAYATVPLLIAVSPLKLPRTSDIHVGGSVVLFTFALALVAPLIFGLAPALRSFAENRTVLTEGAKSVTASRHQAFAGRVLMVAQTALALVLLSGATLMFRSFLNIISVPPGFETRHLLTLQVPLGDARYKTAADTSRFAEAVVEKLRAMPGVQSAAYTSALPFVRGLNEYVVPAGNDRIEVNFATEFRAVTPGYFETLRSSILVGRAFNASDAQSSLPVVIVNKTLADRWWPHSTPVGQQVRDGDSVMNVIGVAADFHESSLDLAPEPMIIGPVTQVNDTGMAFVNRLFPASFLIRTSSKVDLAKQIRDAVRSIDSAVPVENIRPMDEVIDVSLTAPRFFGSLFGAFAGFALLLTAIGIYGLFSYLITQKTREIGVRMALGASRAQVLTQFLRQAAGVCGLGAVAGLAGAFGLTRFLRAFLFEVRPTDPLALTAATLVLAFTAILAALVPSLRATRVDPLVALRDE